MNFELRQAWSIAGISIIVLLLLALIFYQQAVLYLISLWNQYETGNYAHGYLVLAISLYLIVRNRGELALLRPCPNYRALPTVLVASLLWLMAVLVDVNMMQAVALLLLLLAIVWVLLGNQVIRKLSFPILFISFAIPIWFPLSPILQNLTADVVFWTIRLMEVPAARQDNMIMLPAGTFSVEEECSGLRYLLAALTLGTLYAYLNYRTLRARVIVVLVSTAAAVLANFMRVFIVVYLGYETDMQHPYVHDHLMLGWYLFGALIVLLLFIDAGLQRHYQRNHCVDKPCENINENPPSADCTKGLLKYMVVVFACVLMLSVGPTIAYSVNNPANIDNSNIEIDLPGSVAGWDSLHDINDDWMPVYHGAGNRKQVYQKHNDKITLYVGCYMAQQQGRELINDLNRISDGNAWKIAYPKARLKHTRGHDVLEQLLETNDGKQRLVWYWYRIAGWTTTNKYKAKIFQLLALLKGDHQACVMAVATKLAENPEIARNRLSEFAFEVGPVEVSVID